MWSPRLDSTGQPGHSRGHQSQEAGTDGFSLTTFKKLTPRRAGCQICGLRNCEGVRPYGGSRPVCGMLSQQPPSPGNAPRCRRRVPFLFLWDEQGPWRLRGCRRGRR